MSITVPFSDDVYQKISILECKPQWQLLTTRIADITNIYLYLYDEKQSLAFDVGITILSGTEILYQYKWTAVLWQYQISINMNRYLLK